MEGEDFDGGRGRCGVGGAGFAHRRTCCALDGGSIGFSFVAAHRNFPPEGRAAEQRCHAPDLALPRQEHQHVPRMRLQCVLDRTPHLVLALLLAPRGEMRDAYRIAAPFARQTRRIEELCQPLAVERGRHHHDAQVLAHLRLHVQRQREAEVAGHVPLVEFIEEERADALEHRVVLDHAGEDALGDDLDTRCRGDATLEADAVADRVADLLATLRGHETGGRARGHAPRFQHEDPAPGQPGRIEQRRRHLRGLARARWRFQHQPRMRGERFADARQQRIDGEGARIRGSGFGIRHGGARVIGRIVAAGRACVGLARLSHAWSQWVVAMLSPFRIPNPQSRAAHRYRRQPHPRVLRPRS